MKLIKIIKSKKVEDLTSRAKRIGETRLIRKSKKVKKAKVAK